MDEIKNKTNEIETNSTISSMRYDPWTKHGVIVALTVAILSFAGNVAYNFAKSDFNGESIKRIESNTTTNANNITDIKINMITKDDFKNAATKDDIKLILDTIKAVEKK